MKNFLFFLAIFNHGLIEAADWWQTIEMVQQTIDGNLDLCLNQRLNNIECAGLLHDRISSSNGVDFSCMATHDYSETPLGWGCVHTTTFTSAGNNYYAVCSKRAAVSVFISSFENSVSISNFINIFYFQYFDS